MRVHFSTDDLPPHDREQFWLDVVAKHALKMTPLDRPDAATFRAQFDAQATGRFALYALQTSHRIGGRTAADVARESSGRFQLRRVYCEQMYSAAVTPARSVDVQLAAGDFCVVSCEWQCQHRTVGGVSAGGLVIPHEVLSPLLAAGNLTRPVAVRAGSPLGGLLGVAFDVAFTQIPLLSVELGD